MGYPADSRSRVDRAIAAHIADEGPLLPILHAVQEAKGCIDAAAEVQIAAALNLSRAEVHGVVSFYSDFRAEADLRPEISLCRGEACQSRGVEALMPAAQRAAGERVLLSSVYCLGMCGVGPNARIGGRVLARLDEIQLVQLIEAAA